MPPCSASPPDRRWSRRRLIELGALAPLGLNWAHLLHAAERRLSAADGDRPRGFGQARSCILIFLWGGPGQQDLWDMKPLAPAALRSEFAPIATRVPGVSISEQLPHLAQVSDRYTIVRSMTHKDFEHGTAAYTALTGQPHPLPGTNTPASPDDFPTYGSVVTRLVKTSLPVPEAVVLGPVIHQGNRPPVAGQNAGFLGPGYDAFRIEDDPGDPDFRVQGLALSSGLTPGRIARRRALLAQLNEPGPAALNSRQVEGIDGLYQRAFDLLGSASTRAAFDVSTEKPATREAYGGSRFGQTLLLSRRLVEAGVPMITINWAKQNADQWDTHKQNYPTLRKLLPPFDQALAALLADLDDRGLLDSTLVVCLGEFGRTPTINKDGGRDHWPDCYSLLLAGGGIARGTVHGASDREAAYPLTDRVAPWDLAATLYHLLGIDPARHIHDKQGRPYAVSQGKVVAGLLG